MGNVYDSKGRDLTNEYEGRPACFCGAEYRGVQGAPLVPWVEIEARIETGEYMVVDGQVVVAAEYQEWKKA